MEGMNVILEDVNKNAGLSDELDVALMSNLEAGLLLKEEPFNINWLLW